MFLQGLFLRATLITLLFPFWLASCAGYYDADYSNPQFATRIDSQEDFDQLRKQETLLTVTPEKAALHPNYQVIENIAVPFAPEYRLGPGDVIETIYHVNYERGADDYRLEIQDKISISFPFHPQFSCTVIVRTDGKITVPILGDVQAESLTPPELAEKLNSMYSKYILNPNVTVALEDFNVKIKELKRSITTAPRGQSKIAPISQDGTISFPIIGTMHAEGLTLRQLEDRVNKEYAKHIKNLKTTLVLLEIHHNKFYIIGEVEKPGAYEATGRINLLNAIAMANGYRKTAYLEDIVVFRNYGLEKPIAFKVNLQRALKEGWGFPIMEIYPADIIYVPKSPIDNFNDLVEKIFTRGIYAMLPFQSVFSLTYGLGGKTTP